MSSTPRTDPDERADPLGGETPAPRGSVRARMRSTPGLRHLWRGGIFVLGLLCIAAGGALIVLPGPLTIPPIVLGLWIWSTEFEWAHRFFAPAQEKGKAAWEHAKRHPVSSSFITGGGLVMAAVIIWVVVHFELVDRGKELVGLS
ncbi:MAG: PGPGW domain-containing protein [Nocardioidaceae bacterium]